MVRYSRRSTRKLRKRRSPRRTLRSRRIYGKQRRYRRYSRYPRRVEGPSLSPKRYFRAYDWKADPSPGSTTTHAFQIDKTVPFDAYTSGGTTYPGHRQFWMHPLAFAAQGENTWERLSNRIYVHGFRFNFGLHSQFPYKTYWLNGDIHMAVVQMHDADFELSNVKPSFSTPIGSPSNDDRKYIPFDDTDITRADAKKGKLRHDMYNVITHRKFHVNKLSNQSNQWFNKDVQFYLPIKKAVSFQSNTDLYGAKPFYVIMWWMPATNRHDDATTIPEEKYITCDHFRYATYFKNQML